MFITKEEFTSHIYEEAMQVVSRSDDTKITDALIIGMQTATRYLAKYDTAIIYATQGEDRAKYSELINYIKDIAKWHFVSVCNVTVDLELCERRYKAAIAELNKIQNQEPIQGYPLLNADQQKPYRSGSNRKRSHYY